MAYLKGVLATVAALFLASIVPTIWTLVHGLSTEKQTGLTAVAGGTLESIVSPWFWPLVLLFSVSFYFSGRFENKALRTLLFWIPTIMASAMGFGFSALFTILFARLEKGCRPPSEHFPRVYGTCSPKNFFAFWKQIFRTMPPTSPSSFGRSPFSISLPSRLHSTRRKYSCRGNDMNDRESVTMPTKRDSNPVLESALSCHSMASF